MNVKELILLLKVCDPNSQVFIEANSIPEAKFVQEYINKNDKKFIYITDSLEDIENCFIDSKRINEKLMHIQNLKNLKDMLKNGSVVMFRNGKIALVVDKTLLFKDGSFDSLDNFSDNLTVKGNPDYDIIKIDNDVENIIYNTCNTAFMRHFGNNIDKWTWERQ